MQRRRRTEWVPTLTVLQRCPNTLITCLFLRTYYLAPSLAVYYGKLLTIVLTKRQASGYNAFPMSRVDDSPEAKARENIDKQLVDAGWTVQSRDEADISAGRGVAIREFPMKSGFGEADYPARMPFSFPEDLTAVQNSAGPIVP